MSRFTRGSPKEPTPPATVVQAVDRKIESWRRKGDKAKRVARSGTAAIVLSSALVPVVLLVSTTWSPFVLGKVIPSLLAAVAASAASWMQFERPYEGWALYRGYQHALEMERLLYSHQAGPYSQATDRDGVLIKRLATYQSRLEEEWRAHIPTESEITGQTKGSRTEGNA